MFLVYDITRKESFDLVQYWIKDIREKGPEGIAFMLIGNKKDLEEEREVSIDDGKKMAEELGGIPFMEVSAKTGENLKEAFLALTELTMSTISKKKQKPVGFSTPSSQQVTITKEKPKDEPKCC